MERTPPGGFGKRAYEGQRGEEQFERTVQRRRLNSTEGEVTADLNRFSIGGSDQSIRTTPILSRYAAVREPVGTDSGDDEDADVAGDTEQYRVEPDSPAHSNAIPPALPELAEAMRPFLTFIIERLASLGQHPFDSSLSIVCSFNERQCLVLKPQTLNANTLRRTYSAPIVGLATEFYELTLHSNTPQLMRDNSTAIFIYRIDQTSNSFTTAGWLIHYVRISDVINTDFVSIAGSVQRVIISSDGTATFLSH